MEFRDKDRKIKICWNLYFAELTWILRCKKKTIPFEHQNAGGKCYQEKIESISISKRLLNVTFLKNESLPIYFNSFRMHDQTWFSMKWKCIWKAIFFEFILIFWFSDGGWIDHPNQTGEKNCPKKTFIERTIIFYGVTSSQKKIECAPDP